MNQTEAKALIIDMLSGTAPEGDFAALPGKAQLRDELDLDSMGFLNFVAALRERTILDIPETDCPDLFGSDGTIA
jgi:acyl carrier protein